MCDIGGIWRSPATSFVGYRPSGITDRLLGSGRTRRPHAFEQLVDRCLGRHRQYLRRLRLRLLHREQVHHLAPAPHRLVLRQHSGVGALLGIDPAFQAASWAVCEGRFLDVPTAAKVCRADTKVRGRFCIRRCGPSRRRARNPSAALRNFVRHPKGTFSTLLALFGPHAMSDLSPECARKRASADHSESIGSRPINAPPAGSRLPTTGETPDRRGWWRASCSSPRASSIPTAFSPAPDTCREPGGRLRAGAHS